MAGVALVVVEKSLNGKKFVNTHGLAVGGTDGAATADEVATIIGTAFLDNTGDLLPTAGNSPLGAILLFERALYSSIVRFEKILVTDRKNYVTGPDTIKAFKSFKLNFSGANTFSTANSIELGSIIMSMTRRAVGVGAEDGELEYRALLNKEDTRNVGPDMVDWSSDQNRIAWGTRLEAALNGSPMSTLLSNALLGDGIFYVIPRYSSKLRGDAQNGNIIGGYPCEALVINGPKSRQVRGGRRKKKATT